jgi:energy-coupling factor transporter ATP-binding protein EcfA2
MAASLLQGRNTRFARSSRELNDVINAMRRVGASHEIDLPTLVVCGAQSAGKSSLLEALSGIALPRSEGTCTRCPTEVRLLTSYVPE